MSYGENFRTWLKEAMKDNGFNQREIAREIGVSESLIGAYLQGHRLPGYKVLQNIKDVFLIDMDKLFEGGENANKTNGKK